MDFLGRNSQPEQTLDSLVYFDWVQIVLLNLIWSYLNNVCFLCSRNVIIINFW